MPTAIRNQALHGEQIPSRTTRYVLRSAVNGHARATIRVRGDGFTLECRGSLIAEEESYLIVKLRRHDRSIRSLLADSPTRVSFDVGAERYVFETPCPVQWDDNDSGLMRVPKPDELSSSDRRRSLRRRLHRPMCITLESGGAGGDWKSEGAMLNLSPDGIACRVPTDRAQCLRIGQTVRVGFDAAAEDRPFDWPARVTNMTKGGTTDHTVVGLEFIREKTNSEDRRRLRRALEDQYHDNGEER